MDNKIENKLKSRDVFYAVIALATLIVAIIGATLAYFSITASSQEGAVNAKAAVVSVNYEDSQQITTNAQHLIPADFENVVKRAYAKIDERKTVAEAAGDDISSLCRDDAEAYPDNPEGLRGYEVCSVYRFSISSDQERNITAKLLNENNTFTYLAYAVYDVTNSAWINLEGNVQTKDITKCDSPAIESETEIPCFSVNGANEKTYTNPTPGATSSSVNSLFGYTISGDDTLFTQRVVSNTSQVYDVVLFLKENTHNQNVDQGAVYSGTIEVEVTGGATGRITGRMSGQ